MNMPQAEAKLMKRVQIEVSIAHWHASIPAFWREVSLDTFLCNFSSRSWK